MTETLEQSANSVEGQTNAFFTREDNRKCAKCGGIVIGRGYEHGGLVYHTREESEYMHKALCCE